MKTKLTPDYRIAELKDLKVGLKYIRVIQDWHSYEAKTPFREQKELKKIYFHIHTIDNTEVKYKDCIKKWVKNKEIYIK